MLDHVQKPILSQIFQILEPKLIYLSYIIAPIHIKFMLILIFNFYKILTIPRILLTLIFEHLIF